MGLIQIVRLDAATIETAAVGPSRGRNVDHDAMALREQGHSYASIAHTLGLKRAADARGAFLRELRSRPLEERQQIVDNELGRLDTLEARIRARDAEEPDKLERRLGALAAMRESLR